METASRSMKETTLSGFNKRNVYTLQVCLGLLCGSTDLKTLWACRLLRVAGQIVFGFRGSNSKGITLRASSRHHLLSAWSIFRHFNWPAMKRSGKLLQPHQKQILIFWQRCFDDTRGYLSDCLSLSRHPFFFFFDADVSVVCFI